MKHRLPVFAVVALMGLSLSAFVSSRSSIATPGEETLLETDNGAIYIRPRSADGSCGLIDQESASVYEGRETIVQFEDGTCNHACNARLTSGPGVPKTMVDKIDNPYSGRGTAVITRGGTAQYSLHGASPAWCAEAIGT